MRSRIIIEGLVALLLLVIVGTCRRTATPQAAVPQAEETQSAVSESVSAPATAQNRRDRPSMDASRDRRDSAQSADDLAGSAARVTAADPGAVVNVRSRPSESSDPIGQGSVGDTVILGPSEAAPSGHTWHQVTFRETGLAGWIRGDFLDMQDAAAVEAVSSLASDAEGTETTSGAADTARDVLKDALDEHCGSTKALEAYFVAQSYTIYLCKVRGKRLYLSQEEGTENVIIANDVDVRGGGYIITNGDYEYRLDSTSFTVLRIDDSQDPDEVIRESVVYTERY